MKVARVVIDNFRSVKHLEFEPGALCTLIGENNSGKSTIMRALNLVLGETWPSERAFDESDFHSGNVADPIAVQVYFDTPIQETVGSATVDIHGFELACKCYKRRAGDKQPGDLGIDFVCLGPRGGHLPDPRSRYRQGGPPPPALRVTAAMRSHVPLLYVDVMREYSRQQPSSRWSVLRRLLDQIQLSFRNDRSNLNVVKQDGSTVSMSRQDAFQYFIGLAHELLRTKEFAELESKLEANALEQMGLVAGRDGVSLSFASVDPASAYKALDLLVEQLGVTSQAQDVGAGMQSAIVVAIFRTYEELHRGGAIFAVEEPEAFLHPQKARYFSEVLERIADAGNQVFATTHSPFFVKLHRPESLAVVRRTDATGTSVVRAGSVALAPDLKAALKLQTAVNASRGEMLFARRVLLVEGATEAVALPFVLQAMGIDANREGVTVVECGSKTSIPFFMNIASAFGIPFVVLADDDGPKAPQQTVKLRQACPAADLFLMNPDFETECGYMASDKLVDAHQHFSRTPPPAVPQVIQSAIKRLMAL